MAATMVTAMATAKEPTIHNKLKAAAKETAVVVMATATAMVTVSNSGRRRRRRRRHDDGGDGDGNDEVQWTMMMMTTTAAAAAKMRITMISNPHVALNREQNGGIVDFVFVGSETQQRTVSGDKVAEVKRG
jgi:hypothetical protein